MIKKILFWLFLAANYNSNAQIYLPIAVPNRTNVQAIELTNIGAFGMIRKARPNVPEHLHTGIDIQRPVKNYKDEPIFPIAQGIVISLRNDGPFAQIIIAHSNEGMEFFSVYEHIAGIECKVGEDVNAEIPIARFMNEQELNQFGWQFDHFHLELMKVEPQVLAPTKELPQRYYGSYWLSCFTAQELSKYYYNPLHFLEENM